MTDYIILQGSSAFELQKSVNSLLRKGYVLVGGVCFIFGNYAQAMAMPANSE